MIIDQPNVEQAADIVAINQLAASYADAMSRMSVREAVQVYAENGVLRTPTTEPAVGREAIIEVIGRTVATFDLLFIAVQNGLVQIDGDTARSRFAIREWSIRSKDQQGFLFFGYYEDRVVRTPEGWRFAERLLIPRTMGKVDFLSGKLHQLGDLQPWT